MDRLTAGMNMGSNLRLLRKKHKYTQDRLVARLGILGVSTTRSLYSRYETGELNIPVRLLVALHMIYGCSYDAFFAGLELENTDTL